ncbi:MAG TPA: hydrogenase assembly protein HupF, partial [Verrucomicrobia bacterium]|nr:hydrogenase assembly protein HupF [Verrucomicrobiota bacterium]
MCLAVPGRVVSIDTGVDPLDRMGMVDFGGVTRRIALGLIEDAQPGDDVLVHAGMA